MRNLFAIIIFSFTLFISCSKKEEQPMQQEKQPTMTEDQKFAPLTDNKVSQLLEKAKEAGKNDGNNPTAVLSQEEINAILAKVANTNVDQVAQNEIALLETNMGTIAIAFYSDIAPEHTKGFKRLVTTGYYDGTRFHRIIDNFMIQGGDILTRDNNPDNDGTGGPGYNLPAEFNNIPHDLGILSMARAQDPDSASSQFFICLDHVPFLNNQYTAWGKVVEGMENVHAIKKGEPPREPTKIVTFRKAA